MLSNLTEVGNRKHPNESCQEVFENKLKASGGSGWEVFRYQGTGRATLVRPDFEKRTDP